MYRFIGDWAEGTVARKFSLSKNFLTEFFLQKASAERDFLPSNSENLAGTEQSCV